MFFFPFFLIKELFHTWFLLSGKLSLSLNDCCQLISNLKKKKKLNPHRIHYLYRKFMLSNERLKRISQKATWSHLLLNWCIWADYDCVYWESFHWCLQMFVYLSKLGTELMSAHRRSWLFWGSRLLYAQSLDPNLRMMFLSHKWQEEEEVLNWLWITPHLQLCIISFTHYLCLTT